MSMENRDVRVLLCDDQTIVGAGLRQMLADRSEVVIRQVTDPTLLLREIQEFKPTVILQDLVLPEFSGVELVRAVRAEEGARDIPVILLSTTDDSRIKLEAFEAGASDYIVKFPEAFELWGRISYHSRAYYAHQAREQAARMLAQKGRIEALGSLAAGIAHEINTPLQYIGANLGYVTDVLRADLEKKSDSKENREVLVALEEAIQGIQQISSIVRAMKAFAHPGKEEKVPISVLELLHDVELLSRAEWRDYASFEVVCEPGLGVVQCSPGGIAQVLINLVVNSAQAIRARLEAGESEHRGSIRVSARAERGCVVLAVGDNGGGIPQEVQQRLFEPFFTTKERGEGSGQGLALSRSIIEDGHSGTISFTTTPGVGTTFEVRLPQSEQVHATV